jgi:gliding motility-associated-like protein
LKTGCISDPINFSIADETVYPDFDLQLFDAICNKSDGKALILIKTFNLINNINWYIDNGTFLHQGDELMEIAAGAYTVEAIGDNLCKTTKNFEINSDINIFNGISTNEDGNNDWFVLDCIESYPDNNVKIFNRSGTLVYETDHYDNHYNRFNGLGNRGIYLGSKELPAGTYFYVIDLNNGSKPRSGYLELIR